jgi:NAD(P)-dependent dehydrogenase (short-subunit alcohol dehydrogenase family)
MNESKSLAGQVALVTGAGRGLGRAYAEALAGAGAAVAVMARTAAQLDETVVHVEAAGGRARAYPGDITGAPYVARTVAGVERELGAIDLLVNAAGAAEPFGPLEETDPDEWWRGMEINAKGPFLTTRFVLPGMLGRGRGRIVNVSSGVGTRAVPLVSSYGVAKTALIRMTECVSVECAPRGVRVFSISPGMVRTDMNRSILGHPRSKEWFPWAHEAIAAGKDRPASASAALVLRLARGDGDALSGRHITVADDLDALVARAAEAREREALVLRLGALP